MRKVQGMPEKRNMMKIAFMSWRLCPVGEWLGWHSRDLQFLPPGKSMPWTDVNKRAAVVAKSDALIFISRFLFSCPFPCNAKFWLVSLLSVLRCQAPDMGVKPANLWLSHEAMNLSKYSKEYYMHRCLGDPRTESELRLASQLIQGPEVCLNIPRGIC